MSIEAWMDGHKYDEFDAEQVRKSFEKFKAEHPMEENIFAPPPPPLASEQVEKIRKQLEDIKLKGSYPDFVGPCDGEVDLIEESRKVMPLMMANGGREPTPEELKMCCCEPDKTVDELFRKLDDPYEQARLQEGRAVNQKVSDHAKLCRELNTIFEEKNAAYGDSFFETFDEEGWAMPRIRLTDKLNRFKTLSRSPDINQRDESIRDTLMDLANYALMTILAMED